MNMVDDWIARRLTSEEIHKEIEENALRSKRLKKEFDLKYPPELWKKYTLYEEPSLFSASIEMKFFTDEDAIKYAAEKGYNQIWDFQKRMKQIWVNPEWTKPEELFTVVRSRYTKC